MDQKNNELKLQDLSRQSKLREKEAAYDELEKFLNKMEVKLKISETKCGNLNREVDKKNKYIKHLETEKKIHLETEKHNTKPISLKKQEYKCSSHQSCQISSDSEDLGSSDNSYFAGFKRKMKRMTPNMRNSPILNTQLSARPSTYNIKKEENRTHGNLDHMKSMLDSFTLNLKEERENTMESQLKGLEILQTNMKKIADKTDLQRSLSSITMNIDTNDIRAPNGQGIFAINKYISQIEKADQDDHVRKILFTTKSDRSVITLLGGEETIKDLKWLEIKEKLRGNITDSDPIEVLTELRKCVWLGLQDPVAWCTTLRDKYETLASEEKLPKSYKNIMITSLVTKMNTQNKATWGELLRENHIDNIKKLSKTYNRKGRSYLFDDEEQIRNNLEKINTIESSGMSNIYENRPQPGQRDHPFPTQGVQRDSQLRDFNEDTSRERRINSTQAHRQDEEQQRRQGPWNRSYQYDNRQQRYPQQWNRQNRGNNQTPYWQRERNTQPYDQRRETNTNEHRTARNSMVSTWKDWRCANCSTRNQKFYFRCIQCRNEAQTCQIPPNSWQCRHTGCELSRNNWIGDNWCFCGKPNTAIPGLGTKPSWTERSTFSRARTGEYRESDGIIEPQPVITT